MTVTANISSLLTISGSIILSPPIPALDVSVWKLPAGSGQIALVALVAQRCHSRKRPAALEAWDAGVKAEVEMRGRQSCET